LYVQLVFELDRRLRKQQEHIMTSFKVVALALLSATASTRLGHALSSSSSEESHENNRDNEMKNRDTQKTSLAERLADGRRYASGKTAEAVDLSNFLQAVIRSGDRVCLEGDNQKQADVLAAALAKIDPAKVHDLHTIQYAAAEL
jgi:Malonate decarboxylase, alpha subunit, transporter